ncbi:Serpin B10 [Trichoplax sp. H2]|nr:Serpin B10 [Trichoplax sp. H2]|eukprot:RDD43344.1 Serpin B10 [Trichoplax sp. H2]
MDTTAINDVGCNLLKQMKKRKNIIISPLGFSTALAVVHYGANGETAKQLETVLQVSNGSLLPNSLTFILNEVENWRRSCRCNYKMLQDILGHKNDDDSHGGEMKYAKSSASLFLERIFKRGQIILNHDSYNVKEVSKISHQIKGHFFKVSVGLFCSSDIHLSNQYHTQMAKIYHGTFECIRCEDDMDAYRAINKWVKRRSMKRITSTVSERAVRSFDNFFVITTLSFNCRWEYQFSKGNTTTGYFYEKIGKSHRVKMMKSCGWRLRHMHERQLGFEILELPYECSTLSMYIMMPYDIVSLDTIEKHLTGANINQWILKLRPKQVDLTMPRFGLKHIYNMNDIIKAMGATSLFHHKLADLSGITTEKDCCLARFIHSLSITLDEYGTTAMNGRQRKASRVRVTPPTSNVKFTVDHPFIYFICEKQFGCMLYLGRLYHPS